MRGEVLTVEEVAKLLRVSRKTVEKLIYRQKLHAVKVGRVWRIPGAAVEAFLEGRLEELEKTPGVEARGQ